MNTAPGIWFCTSFSIVGLSIARSWITTSERRRGDYPGFLLLLLSAIQAAILLFLIFRVANEKTTGKALLDLSASAEPQIDEERALIDVDWLTEPESQQK